MADSAVSQEMVAEEEQRPRWKVVVTWAGKGPPIPTKGAEEVGLYGLGSEVTKHTRFVGWRKVAPGETTAEAILALFLEKEYPAAPEGLRCAAVRIGNRFWSPHATFIRLRPSSQSTEVGGTDE